MKCRIYTFDNHCWKYVIVSSQFSAVQVRKSTYKASPLALVEVDSTGRLTLREVDLTTIHPISLIQAGFS